MLAPTPSEATSCDVEELRPKYELKLGCLAVSLEVTPLTDKYLPEIALQKNR